MSTKIILDNEFATLWLHPETKIIHHFIKKFVFGDALRGILDKGYEILKQEGCSKWLSDDRNNSALSAEDTKWAQTDWFPRVQKAGWKYWAIVMPEKVIGQINMKKFIEDYKNLGIDVNVFSKPEDALKWLEAK
jgi:hypothetical protein